ncbi:MAG: fibronectin type III domain-containing protein [Actinomycetota bacterium]
MTVEADIPDEPRADDPTGLTGPTIPPEGSGTVGAGANDDFFASLQLPSPTDLPAPGPTVVRPAERPDTRRARFVEPPERTRRRLPVPVIAAVAGAAVLALVVVGIVTGGGDSDSVSVSRAPRTRSIPTVPRTTIATVPSSEVPVEEEVLPVVQPATTRKRATNSDTTPPDPTPQETLPPGTPPTLPAPVVPDAPTGISATPDATATTDILVTWSAPAFDGGSPITGYQVQVDGVIVTTTAGTSYSAVGLSEGTHQFAVAAVNAVGVGASATTSATVPPQVPAAAAPSAGGASGATVAGSPDGPTEGRAAEPLVATGRLVVVAVRELDPV